MKILTLTGPSCSGKTTLLNELVEKHGFQSIVSHTTRPMRPGEIEGKDYYFISDDHFNDKLAHHDFIESITFNGFSYGVSLAEIEAAENAGKKAVLIVEPNGLAQMIRVSQAKPHIEIKSVYIGGDTLELMTRYLSRTAGEDMGAEGVAQRHARRIHSLVQEKVLWKPWTMTICNTDPLKNPGSLPYAIILEELGPDNFESTIKQINELKYND